MKCKTIREGKECIHQKPNGLCVIIGCENTIDLCSERGACNQIDQEGFCKIYFKPRVIWCNIGGCGRYSNKSVKIEEERKLNPLKASKRMKGKKK
jgi:hypothetical protein